MMTVEHDSSRGVPDSLALIEAIVNTRYGSTRADEWNTPAQLQAWLQQRQLLAHETALTKGDQRRMIEMREALRGLLRANNGMELAAESIETLNHLAGYAPMIVRFRQDGLADLAPDIEGLEGVIGVVCASVYTAMVDGTWARLKVCRNEPCQKAFYDTSKNRSGAWCSMARCGSRLKARAYRQRQHKHDDQESDIQM